MILYPVYTPKKKLKNERSYKDNSKAQEIQVCPTNYLVDSYDGRLLIIK